MSSDDRLAAWIERACVLEATARKPGNVHPGESFDDVTYDDFVNSAKVIAPILAKTRDIGVGETILQAVAQTQERIGSNTNLGIILLMAPMAAVPVNVSLQQGIAAVLESLTIDDSRRVFEAIRLANPGGLGTADNADVNAQPTGTLREMMILAAGQDRIASEYERGFAITMRGGDFLGEVVDFALDWESAIIELHLRLMADYPDTLIARKCGPETAETSANKARAILEKTAKINWWEREDVKEFDAWLREDGHKRNPGTTADLVAASLFAAMREGLNS